MRYTKGSPTGPLTLAPGVVRFTDKDGDTWDVPLIGFAVVADGYYPDDDDSDLTALETSIEPIVLEDGNNPIPLRWFICSADHRDDYEVIIGGGSS
jgi:hypothetical protein